MMVDLCTSSDESGDEDVYGEGYEDEEEDESEEEEGRDSAAEDEDFDPDGESDDEKMTAGALRGPYTCQPAVPLSTARNRVLHRWRYIMQLISSYPQFNAQLMKQCRMCVFCEMKHSTRLAGNEGRGMCWIPAAHTPAGSLICMPS